MSEATKPPRQRPTLAERINSEPNESRLSMSRNMHYGAAGVCLLVLTLLVQMGGDSRAFRASLVSSAVGIPVFLLLGSIYEYYIVLGEQSYGHLRLARTQALIGTLLSIGGGALLLAVASLIHAAFPPAMFIFFLVAAIAALVATWFYRNLSAWYEKQPASQEPAE